MGRKAKSIFFAAITFTLLLFMADFVYFSLISHNEIHNSCGCLDFSKHCEHSYSNCFHDEVLPNEEDTQHNRLAIHCGSDLLSNRNFTQSFNSKVWQPPKFS